MKKNYIISEWCDNEKMETKEIITIFTQWCSNIDGTHLTTQRKKEIEILFKLNPILNIICTSMCEYGYNSF